MISWDRCGDSTYIGILSGYEIDVLRSYVDGLAKLIDHHLSSFITAPDGTLWPSPELRQDLRIDTILRFELGQHEPDWVLSFSAGSCLSDISRQVQLMASALPASGGVVQLNSRDEADAWLRCISLVVATIATVADERGEVRGKPCEPTVAWLTEVWAGLHATLGSCTTSAPAG
ncbi:hypothetical protein [Lentzea sp. NPDC004782]|uniref:hypothetical protein n=1 Tax=Lentzea sp. NPDC004782 TaxID=3154458 RepID=UPI0033B93F1C